MIQIRDGNKKDLPAVLSLIKELAVYENAGDEVETTVESMAVDGFGEQPFYHFFVAETASKEIVGIAIYFYTYSTWKGRVLYLEDLVVQAKTRRQGIGKLLFDALVQKSKDVGATRLSWQVLDWNKPAIAFYEKIEAELDGSWINCKLTKEGLANYQ